MKNLYCLLFFAVAFINGSAQWQEANILPNGKASPFAIEAHKGNLYSFALDTFYITQDYGDNWDTLNYTGLNLNSSNTVRHMISTGSYLYLTVYLGATGGSMIYRSNNEKDFIADTANFPPDFFNSGVLDVHDFYHFDDTLYAIVSTGWHYKAVNDAAWQKGTGLSFPEKMAYSSSEDIVMAFNRSGKLETSSDGGLTWTLASNTDLPNNFLCSHMIHNNATNRTWASGRIFTTGREMLVYTDNLGASWDSVALAQYLGTSWIGNEQNILGLYSHDNHTIFALDNDGSNSTPDIFTSVDNGSTFVVDTAGLGTGHQNTVAPSDFDVLDGQLFMALNFYDVFRKQITTGITEQSKDPASIVAYPQPTQGEVKIRSNKNISHIELYNMVGKFVVQQLVKGKSTTIARQKSGTYLARIVLENGSISSKLIIFE